MNNIIPIYIGYDPREAVVFHTCVNSIIRQSSKPVAIIPLALNLLMGYKETHRDGSNQFIYSRFLVPWLNGFQGWALYIDGDMIVRGDISELWELRKPDKDLMVVKHDYTTRQSEKYLGNVNQNYPRKNWSSVMLWNCQNYPTQRLTPDFVSRATGEYLHRFQWLQDDRIGELPPEWNWLPDEYGANEQAKLLHWTLGAPCFHDFSDTEQAQVWRDENQLMQHCEQKSSSQ